MTRRGTRAVALDVKLRDSPDKQPGFRWPEVVDRLLDDLVDLANDAGCNTTRKELIAALVTTARPTGDQLNDMLRTYRRITVGEALGHDGDSSVVKLVRHGPGPRKRAGS